MNPASDLASALASTLSSSPAVDAPSSPRIDDLLARMTLAEKIGQLGQVQPQGRSHEAAVRDGAVGSLINVIGEDARHYQRLAVEESRLGIPLLFGRDVIHGFRTVFPIPLAQAASFDPDLVREAAAAAAREAAAEGVNWTFSPMLDIARDPRWGRIAESFGEDPVLAAAMGAAMVEGYQQQGLAACAKHFVGYGAAEGGRDYAQAHIPERVLHDIYLPPFRAALEAGSLTLMTAFHDLDGVPLTGHRALVRGLLRERWGYQGLVVSDWNSVIEMIVHGCAEDEAEATRRALAASVDMEMASEAYAHTLVRLVEDGRVPLAQVDEAVRRVLHVKERLGLFDAAPGSASPAADAPVPDAAASQALARRLARDSLVLLHNDGVLPLPFDALSRVALIGPMADAAVDQLGCWVFDGDPARSTTVRQALVDRLGADRLLVAPGLPHPRSDDKSGIDDAVAAARAADVAVLCLGEDALLSGEAHSRAHLGLPGAQLALLEAVARTGRPTIVVVLSGRPLVLTDALPHAGALLQAWHPGSQTGPALVDVLGGQSPSGRLPVSLPRSVGQVPIHYNHHRTGRPPLDDAPSIPSGTPLDPSGFYSSYLDEDHRPLFPFGHGLHYGEVVYGDIEPASATVSRGQSLNFSLTLHNRGAHAVVETAQLYVRDVCASVTRPVRELKAFARVPLAPGERRQVTFRLHTDQLAFHGPDLAPVVEPGRHELWIGPDCTRGAHARFDVSA